MIMIIEEEDRLASRSEPNLLKIILIAEMPIKRQVPEKKKVRNRLLVLLLLLSVLSLIIAVLATLLRP